MPTEFPVGREALDKLAALKDDLPTEQALRAAYAALHVFRGIPPSVTTTELGGVQFDWHEGGVDIEIEIGPDGEQVYE
ncbi:hypothetical protein LCGC14_2194210 [marine sediment metagenome]|uniref:Uncharacterized protein n=1 Tax=marine sediment metagenome TaxID=412755 RepID=A0A0F9DIS2_9ZZZZ